MILKKSQYLLLIIISLTKSDLISSFTHYDGEEIPLTVDSLTSITTQIPYDYYYLNICPPEDKMQVPDNLGEILQGSRKYITNYKVNIKNNTNFKILCKKKLSKTNINAFTWLINNNYKINFFLDLLPAGYVELNEENKNIIVSAGAGSGKTAVLTTRVIRKIKEGISINELLILTFTNMAAKEMKERIKKKKKKKIINR